MEIGSEQVREFSRTYDFPENFWKAIKMAATGLAILTGVVILARLI